MDLWPLTRGPRDTRPRAWWLWFFVSLLLHVPLTPIVAFIGLLAFLIPQASDDGGPPPPPITEIPVELLEDEALAGSAPPEPAAAAPDAPPEAAPAPTSKPLKPKPKPEQELDAGVPDGGASDAGIADAGAHDAGAPDADAGTSDAGPRDERAADAGTPGAHEGGDAGSPIADPVAAAGAARSVVDPGSNVRLVVDTAKLRSHPLGRQVGALLGGIYQWRDFFGPTGIDPVRDIDRILVTGPQLRRSADVVAIIQHRIGGHRMHGALDRLVQLEGNRGEWMDAGVPVARAYADRASRFFVEVSPKVVIVTPESALKSAERQARAGSRFQLPPLPGDEVASAYVATPWRAFRGSPLRIPQSIRWARARIRTRADGGVDVDVEAEDENAELAREDAARLERDITAATQLDLGILGELLGQRPRRFIESVQLRADGSHIRGTISASRAQIETILELVRTYFTPPPPPRPRELRRDGG